MHLTPDVYEIQVCRNDILRDLIKETTRANFSPLKWVKVHDIVYIICVFVHRRPIPFILILDLEEILVVSLGNCGDYMVEPL